MPADAAVLPVRPVLHRDPQALQGIAADGRSGHDGRCQPQLTVPRFGHARGALAPVCRTGPAAIPAKVLARRRDSPSRPRRPAPGRSGRGGGSVPRGREKQSHIGTMFHVKHRSTMLTFVSRETTARAGTGRAACRDPGPGSRDPSETPSYPSLSPGARKSKPDSGSPGPGMTVGEDTGGQLSPDRGGGE